MVVYGFYPRNSGINTDIPSTFNLTVGSAYYQQTLGTETARNRMAKVTLCTYHCLPSVVYGRRHGGVVFDSRSRSLGRNGLKL